MTAKDLNKELLYKNQFRKMNLVKNFCKTLIDIKKKRNSVEMVRLEDLDNSPLEIARIENKI